MSYLFTRQIQTKTRKCLLIKMYVIGTAENTPKNNQFDRQDATRKALKFSLLFNQTSFTDIRIMWGTGYCWATLLRSDQLLLHFNRTDLSQVYVLAQKKTSKGYNSSIFMRLTQVNRLTSTIIISHNRLLNCKTVGK